MLVYEVQAEKRYQKTMRPATVGNPLVNNTVDFSVKQIPEQPDYYRYLNVIVFFKLTPFMPGWTGILCFRSHRTLVCRMSVLHPAEKHSPDKVGFL